MRQLLLQLILGLLGAAAIVPVESLFEGRVYEDAPAGTDVTLHPDFETTLRKYRGCLLLVVRDENEKNGQRSLIQNDQNRWTIDSHYFQYDASKLTLQTTRDMDRRVGDYFEVPMAAFCAGDSESVQWMVIVRVSQVNRYSPVFDHQEYMFAISNKAPLGTIVGTIKSHDDDVVIYNSLVSYKLANADAGGPATEGVPVYALNSKTGAVSLASTPSDDSVAELSTTFQVEACDYGSPRKCGSAVVNLVAVKVESPTNITVVTSDPRYQIICWSQPSMGMKPDYYVLRVETEYHNQNSSVITKKVRPQSNDSTHECTVVHSINGNDLWTKSNDTAVKYNIRVITHVGYDEASAEPIIALMNSTAISCSGTCFNNGTPACESLNSTSATKQFYHDGDPYCLCQPGFEGNMCQIEGYCEAVSLQSVYGRIRFPRTLIDKMVSVKCPYGPDSTIVARKCSWSFSTGTFLWGPISGLEQCRSADTYLAATTVTIMKRNDSTTKILDTLSMLEQSTGAIAKDKKMADRMISYINAAVAMDFRNLPDREKLSKRIKTILMSFVEKVPLAPGGSSILSSENVVAAVRKIKPGAGPIPMDIGQEAKLTIPRCVVDQAALTFPEPRISAIWLRDDKIFSFADEDTHDYGQRPALLVKVEGIDQEQELLEPISFSLMSPSGPVISRKSVSEATCVYWQERGSKWSDRGVRRVEVDESSDLVNCETDHLTGFSILLDFEPSTKVDLRHRRTLNLLSWIGCICSIATLCFTIITYALFPCLNRDHAGKVLLNLCTSMLLLNVVFVLSSVRPMIHYSYTTCVGIGAFLHYFTLTTLLWMGIEAANMYQMLVRVFASTERLFLTKRCMVAWGIPFVVVIGTVAANAEHYFARDDDYCRMSSRYPVVQYGVFLAPACMILLVNCIGFAFVLKVLTQTNVSASVVKPKAHVGIFVKYSTLVAQVRGALSVMVLLGITWVLGAFAIGPVRLPFMYAFCTLNSLQGFIIFLVRCLCYDEVRRAWWMFIQTGKLKQQRGKATIEHRLSDSRSTSNPRVRRANTASSDISSRPLTTFRAGDVLRMTTCVERNFRNYENDRQIALIPRNWKYIDEPSTPTVGGF